MTTNKMSLMYKYIVTRIDPVVPTKYLPLWNHPAGPKTVFFWAPLFKFCLVVAGISDLTRSPDKISLAQTTSLAGSAMIWARYCVVITPKNYLLGGINVFVAATQTIQLFRGLRYQYNNSSQWRNNQDKSIKTQ